MGDLRPVIYILGIFVLTVGLAMLVPGLADLLVGNPDYNAFFASSAVALFFGGMMVAGGYTDHIDLDVRRGFLLTSTSWMLVSFFAALPFIFANLKLDMADAYFEAMSGLTTTGATVLSGLDSMPPGILLWRSLLQWIGGLGIIVTAVALLPLLRVGGMQLFRMESSDQSDKFMPRARQVAGWIALLYLGLTLACMLAYEAAGMSLFEAINHAMTTVSTGGYSTSDGSMGHFRSMSIDWIAIVFMMLGGMPFVLMIRALQGRWGDFLSNSQVRGFVMFLCLAVAILTIWQVANSDRSFFAALTEVAFNVVSIVTTTGFATSDYAQWGVFPAIAFFFLTIVGGCTGSTSGGVKIFRFEIMYRLFRHQMRGQTSPHNAARITYNGREVAPDVIRSVGVFAFQFAFILVALALLLSLTGLDMVTSLTGAATALANVGPGLGDIIGPADNFSSLPDSAKWLLSAGMLVGRLEILTVLVLFTPAWWRG